MFAKSFLFALPKDHVQWMKLPDAYRFHETLLFVKSSRGTRSDKLKYQSWGFATCKAMQRSSNIFSLLLPIAFIIHMWCIPSDSFLGHPWSQSSPSRGARGSGASLSIRNTTWTTPPGSSEATHRRLPWSFLKKSSRMMIQNLFNMFFFFFFFFRENEQKLLMIMQYIHSRFEYCQRMVFKFWDRLFDALNLKNNIPVSFWTRRSM